MSTAKKPGDGAKKPPTRPDTGVKKNKSKGFIESSDFKPIWLETGPLSPDMLPEPREGESQDLTDEFDALQAALQRYYGTEPTEPDVAPAKAADAAPEITVETADDAAADAPAPIVPMTVELAAPPPPVEAAEAGVTGEALDETAAPPDPRHAAPPEWLTALLVEATPLETPSRTPALAPPAPALTQTFIEEAPLPRATEPAEMRHEPARPVEQHLPTAPPGSPQAETTSDVASYADEAPLPVPEAVTAPTGLIAETVAAEPLSIAPPVAADDAFANEAVTAETLFDETIASEPTPLPEAIAAPAPATKPARTPRTRRRTVRRPSRLASALFLFSLLLLAAAALIFIVNPFTRLALGTATLARPGASPNVFPPRNASGDWCLTGEGLTEGATLRLRDDGTQGDVLAEDRVFSLQHAFAAPGVYQWQVIDCANPSLVYPPAPAWVTTQTANENVTFVFDPTERADPLFFPISYVVSALDGIEAYQVVGSFQGYNPDDPTARLQRLHSGLYQQVRRIARSGSYEGYVIAADTDQAIDAYGRTTEPIPFSFETISNGEYVVFLLDLERGRASVLYRMPPLLTWLAFGNGYRLLSTALLGLALLLLALLSLRYLVLRRRSLWIESGCPRCHEHELMRIARHSGDRWLHLLGIPAYRYRCRACVWEGRRLSATGESISPGATIAHIQSLE